MLEYIDETHTYLYNGVIIPSVSQILHEKVFPNKYKEVPEYILKAKAEYGTKVHNSVEMYEANINTMQFEEAFDTTKIALDLSYIQVVSLKEYICLKEKYNIQVLEQEQLVCYKGLYAGRFDMVAKINGKLCLVDIKTTAQLDLEYLSWQLSMYELAYGRKFDEFYCIWLPKKDTGKLVKIERKNQKEIEKLFETEKGENYEI